jgi:hypothetical protein
MLLSNQIESLLHFGVAIHMHAVLMHNPSDIILENSKQSKLVVSVKSMPAR